MTIKSWSILVASELGFVIFFRCSLILFTNTQYVSDHALYTLYTYTYMDNGGRFGGGTATVRWLTVWLRCLVARRWQHIWGWCRAWRSCLGSETCSVLLMENVHGECHQICCGVSLTGSPRCYCKRILVSKLIFALELNPLRVTKHTHSHLVSNKMYTWVYVLCVERRASLCRLM